MNTDIIMTQSFQKIRDNLKGHFKSHKVTVLLKDKHFLKYLFILYRIKFYHHIF